MRLIDADALFYRLLNTDPNTKGRFCDGVVKAGEFIINAPTIDAEPVVRCGNCKHYQEPDDGDFLGVCLDGRLAVSNYGEIQPERDFFCPYGERRTNK